MHEQLAPRGLAKPYGINGKRLREAVTSPSKTGQLGFADYDEVCHGHDINTIPLFFVSRFLHVPLLLIPFWSYTCPVHNSNIYRGTRIIFIRNGLSAPLLIFRWTTFCRYTFFRYSFSKHTHSSYLVDITFLMSIRNTKLNKCIPCYSIGKRSLTLWTKHVVIIRRSLNRRWS